MSRAIAKADPDAPVAACPDWAVRDLVAHLTGVHRWALAALDGSTPPAYAEAPIGSDLGGAYVDASQALLARLRVLPAEHPCWTFDKGNRTAGFWRRRQLHEVAVHRWDVEPYTLTDEVATDGIDEVVDFFAPRQVFLGRLTLPEGGLQLQTPSHLRTFGDCPFHRLEGSASDVLLRLWGRGAPLPDGWAGLTP
jgi:uncharacterized protein (TIGR03083 family)